MNRIYKNFSLTLGNAILFFLISIWVGNFKIVYAQDFQKGFESFNKGDFSTAIKEWYPLAEKGNPVAQNNLGVMYENGKGVTQDYLQAVNLYLKSANQGYANAQYNLGVMYYNGYGIAKNNIKALNWFRKAAEQGVAKAQDNLGVMFAKGEGVEKNFKEATKWFRMSAEQGYAKAQFNLGNIYLKNDEKIDQNLKQALKWFRMSAEQGYAKAQYNLSLMYAKGKGVAKNNIYAYMWSNISASSGYQNAIKSRDIFEKVMSSKELIRGKLLAQKCVKKNFKDC